jgi:hypothetical protein
MRAHQSMGALVYAHGAYDRAEAAGKANVVATNLLVDILVDAHQLPEASRVVDCLAEAVSGRRGPEVLDVLPAFGALAEGYARSQKCEQAVDLLRKFTQLGGVPDEQLFDVVLRTCVQCGEVCRRSSPMNRWPTQPRFPTPCSSQAHLCRVKLTTIMSHHCTTTTALSS